MCRHEKNGVCTAQELRIENIEILIDGEFQDFQRCVTLEKDEDWVKK
jgi:hypothetical protein